MERKIKTEQKDYKLVFERENDMQEALNIGCKISPKKWDEFCNIADKGHFADGEQDSVYIFYKDGDAVCVDCNAYVVGVGAFAPRPALMYLLENGFLKGLNANQLAQIRFIEKMAKAKGV